MGVMLVTTFSGLSAAADGLGGVSGTTSTVTSSVSKRRDSMRYLPCPERRLTTVELVIPHITIGARRASLYRDSISLSLSVAAKVSFVKPAEVELSLARRRLAETLL